MKMTRTIEKRDWRNNLEKCWNVQESLNKCILGSENFNKLDKEAKATVVEATSKNFIWNYLNMWAGRSDACMYDDFFRTDSNLWNKNEQAMVGLNNECNLFSLYECCKETYHLNNLKGHYEYYNRNLKVEK
jgi:hypothetical protein